jgi:mannose-6-phosphate isomerase-like protein (cupin superfamily)
MQLTNLFSALETAPMDDYAGIKIVKLTGDADLSMYVADIAPKTALTPHYHNAGIDVYQILEGEGTMKLGRLVNNAVVWTEIFTAHKGDCFTVEAGVVHQLLNDADVTLHLVFACPESHVGSDRHFV